MRRITFLGGLFLIAVLLMGCSSKPNTKEAPIPIGEADLALGAVITGMREAEVVEKLGKPSQVIEGESGTLYHFDGMEVVFTEGRVYSIEVTDSRYDTPRGLRVGDDQKKLRQLYGDPAAKDKELWSYSYDGGEYYTFFVKFNGGRIISIKVSLVM